MGNAERKRRELTTDSTCPTCNDQEETTNHIFKTCPKEKQVWNAIGGTEKVGNGREMRRWISESITRQRSSVIDDDWTTMFATTC